jgi:hypothetical protein
MILELTIEETRLLRELCDGVHSICGNKRHNGLNRLVGAKYVESRAISFDAVLYTITALGREALAVVESRQDQAMPALAQPWPVSGWHG